MKYLLCIIYVLEQFTYYCILKVFSMLYTCVFILYNGSKILVYQMYIAPLVKYSPLYILLYNFLDFLELFL